jgi:hypothetical protein
LSHTCVGLVADVTVNVLPSRDMDCFTRGRDPRIRVQSIELDRVSVDEPVDVHVWSRSRGGELRQIGLGVLRIGLAVEPVRRWINVGLPSASMPTCVKTTNPSWRDCSRRTCICGAVPAANCDFSRLSFHVPILGSWTVTVCPTTIAGPTTATRIATAPSETQYRLITVLRPQKSSTPNRRRPASSRSRAIDIR